MDPSVLLHQFWGMRDVELRPLGGGMNSTTWLVEHHGSMYVAKHVPASAVAALAAGGEIASTLANVGFVTGPPVPTCDGELILPEEGLAVLEHVSGRELNGDSDVEQRWMAETLAGIHNAGMPELGPPTASFQSDWLSPDLPGVDVHAWLCHAIETVRAESDSMVVTWSILHTDPAPEAFVHDDTTGVTGLIDWAGAQRGPVLYDVASAVMYLGGPEAAKAFLTGYERVGPLLPGEMRHLAVFRRFRWAVQGAYFAGRLAAHDLTGGVAQADNRRGLDAARGGLAELGLDVT